MTGQRLRAYGEIFLVILIWGAATIVIKATLAGIAPVPFLTYRFFISSLIALPFLYPIIRLFHKPRQIQLLIGLYALFSAPLALGILFVGLNETSVVNLSLLQALEPLLLAFLGAHLFHDHLSKRAKIGVVIALMGALVTLIEPLWLNFDGGTFHGNALIVLYLLFDAACILILKRLLKKGIDPLALTNLSFILGFVIFLGLTLHVSSLPALIAEVKALPVLYHAGVWYMAILSGTIAFTLRAKAQKTLNISEVSIFGYLAPIISTLLAILFLNESITPLYMLGAAAIAAGVFLVEFKRRK